MIDDGLMCVCMCACHKLPSNNGVYMILYGIINGFNDFTMKGRVEFIFYLFNGVLFLQGSAELLSIAYSVGIQDPFNLYFNYGVLISTLSIIEKHAKWIN